MDGCSGTIGHNPKRQSYYILLYTSDKGEVSIQEEDGTFWLPQKRMAELFGVNVRTISAHLKHLFQTSELQEKRTMRKIRIVQSDGQREVAREVTFYQNA